MKQIITSLILILSFISVSAQDQPNAQNFFVDNENLCDQIKSYCGVKTSLNKDMKTEVELFCNNIQTNTLSGDYRAKTVNLLNIYYKKRAIPANHSLNLIKVVDAFIATGKMNLFNNWYDYIIYMFDQENKSISTVNNFVIFSFNLIKNNNLFESSAKSWHISTNGYDFLIKDNEFIVKVSQCDLTCKMSRDSSVIIYKTQGLYNPDSQKFSGKGGTVDWQKAGFKSDSLYAILNNYTIDMNRADYTADSVKFFNRKYFGLGILGRLQDKSVIGGTGDKARYPVFKSYNNSISIPNFAEGIDYEGGYAQKGILFMGEADSSEYSFLTIYRKGVPFIYAKSTSFVFGDKKLESENASIHINIGEKDSIVHPGLKLKYDSKTQILTMFKGKNGTENAKFIDTYHKLNINVHQIKWIRDDSLLIFCKSYASTINDAEFESGDYFTIERYKSIQMFDKENPLKILSDYIFEYQVMSFSASDILSYYNKQLGTCLSETQIHQMLMKLSYDGYISYYVKKRYGTVQQKLFDYNGDLRNIKDYDCISLISTLNRDVKEGTNAELNLNNNKLTIFNVQPFELSSKRKVKMIPDSAVVVEQNRNMEFRGKLEAGMASIYCKDFKFNYDDFKIKVNKADSMSLKANNIRDNKIIRDTVKSVFENITGILEIDSLNNKSGNVKYDHMPLLITQDTSYVYYDKLTSGKYNRDKFHMTVFPFILDSLNFVDVNGVKAKGSFESGIFPDLSITLTVQPDLSLGFILPTPEEGMDLFSGKGTYHNTVTLNSQGLGGSGEIQYLTATARAKKFMFYPDSVTGYANYLVIKEVVKDSIGIIKGVNKPIPDVMADTAYINWRPHNDIFSASALDSSMMMYHNMITNLGRVDVTPQYMKGEGEISFYNTLIDSKHYRYQNKNFEADSSIFKVMSPENDKDSVIHLITDPYDIKVNLDSAAMLADFIVSNDSAIIKFPVHKYSQKTDFFTWNIKLNQFEFGKDLPDYDKNLIAPDEEKLAEIKAKVQKQTAKPLLSGVKMTADKDTLNFKAYCSSYLPQTDIINIHEPGIINVEDARIDPSGLIYIMPGGRIDEFDNALIMCNKDTLIHKVVNTSVLIKSKHYYKAKGGQYEYHNPEGEISYMNIDSMEVRKIKHDTAQTAPKIPTSFATGYVPEKQNFMLSANYMYAGYYSFNGFNPDVKFNGFAFLKQECDSTIMPFKFEGHLNPDSLIFPISERVIDTSMTRLYTGFFYDNDSAQIYSIFMGHKRANKHQPILESGKNLCYASTTNQYQVASAEKLADKTLNENFISIYKSICFMYGEGNMDFMLDIDPVNLLTKGTVFHQKDVDKVTFNLIMSLNFFVRPDVMKICAESVIDNAQLEPVNLTKESIVNKLNYVLGADTTKLVIEEYSLQGNISKLPAEFKKTIVFTDLQLGFDKEHQSYRSKGKLGLGYINGIAINRYVDGYVEITKTRRNSDRITIYIKSSDQTWYYFDFRDHIMKCLSSNSDFNDKIISTKDKDRVLKYDKNGMYQYIIGNEEEKNKFIRSFPDANSDVENQDQSQIINNIEQLSQDSVTVNDSTTIVNKSDKADSLNVETNDGNDFELPATDTTNNNESDFEIEPQPVEQPQPQPVEQSQPQPVEQSEPQPQNGDVNNSDTEESDFEITPQDTEVHDNKTFIDE